jgi:hypothetical protein
VQTSGPRNKKSSQFASDEWSIAAYHSAHDLNPISFSNDIPGRGVGFMLLRAGVRAMWQDPAANAGTRPIRLH